MPTSPSVTADPPTDARPYGLLGLIVSLLVILALTVFFAIVETVLGIGLLAAAQGLPAALDILRGAIPAHGAAAKVGERAAQRLDVVVGIGAYIALVLAVIAAARFRGGRDWTALVAWRDWQPRRHWKLLLGLFVLTLAWEVAASVGIEHVHPEAKDWVVAPKGTPWIVAFIALAVLAGPIAEEILFRGWIYTSLRAGFGLRVAILVTSVLFAVAHWESTHLYALAVFPVGLALALVRERTGTIAGSITFHALYNGVASVLLFVGK